MGIYMFLVPWPNQAGSGLCEDLHAVSTGESRYKHLCSSPLCLGLANGYQLSLKKEAVLIHPIKHKMLMRVKHEEQL